MELEVGDRVMYIQNAKASCGGILLGSFVYAVGPQKDSREDYKELQWRRV
jgi:hypothetical protein